MPRYYHVSKYLQDISMIIVLIFCLNFHELSQNVVNFLLFIINLL